MKYWAERDGQFAQDVLWDCLHGAKAWESLHDPQVTQNLDMEGMLNLCLAAGYGQEASEKTAREWGLKRMSKDLPA
ncbi:MAG: hypothetical protein K2X38_25475 [Gemmataceae bacterium]|nr:hypothetical protein [Gemmataceae bacterium]